MLEMGRDLLDSGDYLHNFNFADSYNYRLAEFRV